MTGDHGGNTAARTAMSQTMRENESFLRAIFGDHDWERAHVCAVAGDPKKKGPGWFGGFAHLMLVDLKDTTNNYFCVSLFSGPRRRANEFQALVCLAIDDVGPKLDPVMVELLLGPPTWIVETSRDNFQWGYVLGTPITDAAAAADLIHRVRVMLTGEGVKDPGMESVTRYMRLPTGVNLKASLGNSWRVRLVKIDKHIRITETALTDLGLLVPGQLRGQQDKVLFDDLEGTSSADESQNISADASAARIGVHGSDTLLAAMRKLGLVLGRARDTAMGWGFDIICPWVAEHTDRAETGTVYVAGAGKFKCHHGHCIDRTTEDLRRKIDELLRDEGHTGGLICEEFDVVDPSTVPEPPQGLDYTPPIEKEFFDRFVCFGGRDVFYDLIENGERTGAIMDGGWTVPLVNVLPRYRVGKKEKMLSPRQWMRQDKRRRIVNGHISWPGKPRIIAPNPARPFSLYINKWEPGARPLRNAAETEADDTAIKPWLDVFWHVVGWDSAEQYAIGEIILDWLALLIGDLSLKAGWQVIVTGPQGLGKDSIILPLADTIGSDWAKTVQSQQFGTDFNAWAGGRLVQVSETRQNTRGSMTGRDMMNILKVVFDNSRKWLTVNLKYGKERESRNVVMGWFTSNEREPLRLEPGDRRFLVIDRDGIKPLSPKTYEQLHDWLSDETPNTNITGTMRVAEFLYRRWDRMDAPRKKALFGNAPMTDAKREMLARLIDPVEDWIRRCIDLDPHLDPLGFPDIVHVPDVHSRLDTAIKHGGEQLPGGVGLPVPSKIAQLLKTAGAETLNKGKPVKVKGAVVVLWAVRNAGLYNKISVPVDLAKLFLAGTSGTSIAGAIH